MSRHFVTCDALRKLNLDKLISMGSCRIPGQNVATVAILKLWISYQASEKVHIGDSHGEL